MINISYLEVPQELDVELKDAMYLTAQPVYKNINIEFKNLLRMVNSNYRQYSPFIFEGGVKKGENWNNDRQNLIIFDIDNGCTMLEAMEIFEPFQFLIATTKSHQVDKKGVVCDRFRILLPAINVPRGDEYFEAMREIENKYPFIDRQVNTKTGAFLGSSNCDKLWSFHLIGEDIRHFDFAPFTAMAQARKQIKKQQREVERKEYKGSLKVEEIKQHLDRDRVEALLERYGYLVTAHKTKLREERTPSTSITPNGHIKDFGSGFSGDIIDVLQEYHGMSFKEALEAVA